MFVTEFKPTKDNIEYHNVLYQTPFMSFHHVCKSEHKPGFSSFAGIIWIQGYALIVGILYFYSFIEYEALR